MQRKNCCSEPLSFRAKRGTIRFTQWKRAAGFVEYSDVDFFATYLLPSVYGNLTRAGIADPWSPQLFGLHLITGPAMRPASARCSMSSSGCRRPD